MQHFPQFPTIFQENGEFAFFEFWTMVPLRPVASHEHLYFTVVLACMADRVIVVNSAFLN